MGVHFCQSQELVLSVEFGKVVFQGSAEGGWEETEKFRVFCSLQRRCMY